MSPASDPPRPRSWLRLQFSLGTLFWLMLVVGIVMAWWKDRSSFDQRLQKLEQMVAPTQQSLWGAADILGAPDDPTGGAGKSWCPAGTNGADWAIVGFDKAVTAATIDLYETYLVGCVTEEFPKFWTLGACLCQPKCIHLSTCVSICSHEANGVGGFEI